MPRLHLFVPFARLLSAVIIVTSATYVHVALSFLNSPPTAVGESYTVHRSGTLGQLLANDSDPDGDSFTFYDVVSGPSHGTLGVTSNPSYKGYNSQQGYVGPDSFTYRVIDSFGNISNAATVNINVVNTPPIAVNDGSYTVHGSTVVGSLLANDSDADGDTISFYDIVTPPAHGTVSYTANPAYKSYAPQYGYVGPDSFTYRISDSVNVISNTATVTVNVVNNPPAANADFYIVSAGSSTVIGSMRENDFDPDGDSISTPDVVVSPSHGTLNFTANSDFKAYLPNVGFTGTDTFQYRITDSLGRSSDATVYILVLPSGQLPPKVPYAGCPGDPGCVNNFKPESGATGNTTGGPGGSSGPSWPDPVNLATGRETFAPPPDLEVYNPTGPSVVWGAQYFADQALKPISGYGSPGLTRGWLHNYDVRLQGTAGSWSALTLFYPNGSTETVTPVLSGGVPTGGFTTVAGAPYIVTGVSGTPTGTWQSARSPGKIKPNGSSHNITARRPMPLHKLRIAPVRV